MGHNVRQHTPAILILYKQIELKSRECARRGVQTITGFTKSPALLNHSQTRSHVAWFNFSAPSAPTPKP